MTTREILEAARARIDTPEKWTQGKAERDGKLCAIGALRMAVLGHARYASRAGTYVSARGLLEGLADTDPSWFNDSHSHAEVMALFDRAIEAA